MDHIFESWLEHQYEEGMALCAASDVVTLVPEPDAHPPRRYIAHFASPTMVRARTEVTRADRFAVLLKFPADYLRSATDAGQIINLVVPTGLFHPNVKWPFVCIGHVASGTGLVELVYRVYETLVFQKLTTREDGALNHEACAWARRNMQLFPLSTAPLRRRAAAFSVHEISRPGAAQ